MKKKTVNAADVIILSQVFAKKGWEIDDKLELKISTFNRFVDRYGRIPDDTKQLFLELTERFERIETSEIYKLFADAFSKIPEDKLEAVENIYILPLVTPQLKITATTWERFLFLINCRDLLVDRPKSKSGDRVLSLIRSVNYLELNHSEKFEFPESFSDIKSVFNKESDLLILVDDFVGTGDTANRILKEYFKENEFSKESTILVCLISMESGVNKVFKKMKVNTFYSILQTKAISEFYQTKKEINKNLLLLLKMGKSTSIVKSPYRGYGKSEALTTIMNKSPNNTLPIFWEETTSVPAPFPREPKFK